MKKDMEKIDEIIKEALTREEAEFYEELEELNLFEKLGDVFKGKMGWLVIIMNIVSLTAVGFAVYCAIQLFNTENTNELIRWSLGVLFSALMVSMLKLYVWMQMDKNDILREIKRVEFQLSVIAKKSDQ
ncbi:hypothetical protein GWK08_12115 [Leptobacterium flavescens]|uniref:Uncharacterized protein n=1 Tax=Leptobacterium flavescens TaxID=472055 RepID=A0A6P0UP21_9FLAO|nr:DUF6768 family protein [Leptobacterium flavescens]NER14190.1 hypothetical protein [Leptobacterium flavescens]